MKYAIIRLGGKQFKVKENDVIQIEQQDHFDSEVLMFSDGEFVMIGEPTINDYEVRLNKIKDFRGKKVRVARFKSKSRYNKANTHRQPYSSIKVEYIGKRGGYQDKTVAIEKAPEEGLVKEIEIEKKLKSSKIPKQEKRSEKKVKIISKENKVIKKRGRPKKSTK